MEHEKTTKMTNKWRAADASTRWAMIWDELERQGHMILVVAGSYSQFRDWCDTHRVSPKHPSVRYISCREHLMGYHNAKNVHLIKHGTWYGRDDLHDAIAILEQFNPPSA